MITARDYLTEMIQTNKIDYTMNRLQCDILNEIILGLEYDLDKVEFNLNSPQYNYYDDDSSILNIFKQVLDLMDIKYSLMNNNNKIKVDLNQFKDLFTLTLIR